MSSVTVLREPPTSSTESRECYPHARATAWRNFPKCTPVPCPSRKHWHPPPAADPSTRVCRKVCTFHTLPPFSLVTWSNRAFHFEFLAFLQMLFLFAAGPPFRSGYCPSSRLQFLPDEVLGLTIDASFNPPVSKQPTTQQQARHGHWIAQIACDVTGLQRFDGR